MWRVLRPGGRLAVAVWDALGHSPGYAAMAALLRQLFGARVADELRAAFALGDSTDLGGLFAQARVPGVEVRTLDGTARFLSIEAWVRTDVKGWTLADLIDEAQYRTLLRVAEQELDVYKRRDGTVVFGCPAHVATAVKP